MGVSLVLKDNLHAIHIHIPSQLLLNENPVDFEIRYSVILGMPRVSLQHTENSVCYEQTGHNRPYVTRR
jgi:hypothetical protein